MECVSGAPTSLFFVIQPGHRTRFSSKRSVAQTFTPECERAKLFPKDPHPVQQGRDIEKACIGWLMKCDVLFAMSYPCSWFSKSGLRTSTLSMIISNAPEGASEKIVRLKRTPFNYAVFQVAKIERSLNAISLG
jgi:hypothetical protein